MYKYIKRFFDVFISLIGLIFTSPILLIIAVAIKLESKGPIIFKQKRLGLEGKEFNILKFRSMAVGAEKGGVYEKKNDIRVTKVGSFIRKTSIDELPQFINVLRGEMSLIGPRPPLTYHPWPYQEYTEEQRRMFYVRPGITGWAQINGRKDVEWPRRIKLNVEYVDNYSLFFDLKILLKTIIKVVKMEDNVNMKETI